MTFGEIEVMMTLSRAFAAELESGATEVHALVGNFIICAILGKKPARYDDDKTHVSQSQHFGTLLALRQEREPSLVLFVREHDRRPERQTALLVSNLPMLEEALRRGCIALLEESRIRVRLLLIGGGG